MPALKPAEIGSFLAKPDPALRAILIYGPDSGLVSERADKLADACGVDTTDPFATIRLDADTAAADRNRLLDEAFTVAMFGGDRLIRVSGQTRRNLAEAVKPLLKQKLENAWVLIEAGDLKKGTALRNLFEKSPNGAAIPCYLDEGRALDELIAEELTGKGYAINRELSAYLKQFLGGDRMASRNELRKLALYAGNETEITREHITAIVGDASTIDFDEVLDSVSAGEMTALEDQIGRLLEQGMAADMLLLNALRHFQALHEMRGRIDTERLSAKAAVDGARPPVFWKRKDRLIRILSRLNTGQLERILGRLHQAGFEARANPELGAAIAGTCLLAVVLEARQPS
ncbi:DNA polymerase III subunit delta [Salaquimonas pukyongi]|uniref:DNA polymerase III subunit delta n=1 Tax=Salaquimonas pukyongi TaxID=2712698 RepID=UPI00096BA337|nr:DNA polymerase III subunit delta [Salaquimonas pukyongi]